MSIHDSEICPVKIIVLFHYDKKKIFEEVGRPFTCWSNAVKQTADTELGRDHRRRIKTEEKAKVVVSFLGEECIQFLAALAILPRTIFCRIG